MLSENVISKLESNRNRRLKGELVAIPYSLNRLSEYLPGIEQGKYYIVTSAQKGAKTQFTDYMFVFNVVDWYIANKDNTSIKPKIFYFSLEISKELKILSAISYKLFKSHNIIISPQKLRSVFSSYILDEKILNIIKSPEFQEWLRIFEEIVVINDNIRNPTGILKFVNSYAEKNGKQTYTTMDWEENGKIIQKKKKDAYYPNNPDEFVIVITDHIGLLNPEKGMSLHETMSLFSSNYCLQLRDKYNYSIVNVQQQSAQSQDSAFDFKGGLVVDKVKPTPYGLADNKLTARD